MNDYIDKKIFENDLLNNGEKNYKIFDKIKKIFLLLILFLFGLISFGYCSTVDYNWEYLYLESVDTGSVNLTNSETVVSYNNLKGYTYCALVKFTPIDSSKLFQLIFNPGAFGSSKYTTYNVYGNDGVSSLFICGDSNPSSSTDLSLTFIKGDIDNYEIDYRIYKVNQSEDPNVIEGLLQSCSSDLQLCNNNLQSCQNNNACIPGSGDLQYSNIYINNILHPGRQNIFINIPDYITWDYSQNEVDFNVYVGSGYDVDYINSIVDINSYRPTSDDFTNVFVSGLTLVFPYIFVALLILFIWKLVKRIFK